MDEKEPEELWADIKTMIIEETQKTLIRKKKQPTKPWMSEATLKVIEERRIAIVTGNRQAANDINKVMKRAIQRDKETNYQNMCAEIENEHNKGKS